jgi:endogenous inhibitor of DNA gyrase (YacG/DUF329 family)
MTELICQNCGEIFQDERKYAYRGPFCSDKCAREYDLERRIFSEVDEEEELEHDSSKRGRMRA